MRKINFIYILVIISTVFQSFFYNTNTLNPQFTFFTGIDGLDKTLDIVVLFPLLLPILLIILIFNNAICELINKEGKIYIIRNYSRNLLLSKKIFWIFLKIFLLTLFQFIIYALSKGKLYEVTGYQLLKAYLMYINGVFGIILIEQLLQFFIDSSYTTLITSIYVLFSNTIGILSDSIIVKVFLFPSLIFGFYNSSFGDINIYLLNLSIVMLINVILFFVIDLKFKKTDIY